MDGFREAQLQAPVRYRRIGGGVQEARAGHILITLFSHHTHHRGPVHALLSQARLSPPALEVLFYPDEIGQTGAAGTPG